MGVPCCLLVFTQMAVEVTPYMHAHQQPRHYWKVIIGVSEVKICPRVTVELWGTQHQTCFRAAGTIHARF